MKYISAVILALVGLLAPSSFAHAASQPLPSFDEPAPEVSWLTVVLPKGNPYDDAAHPAVSGYRITATLVSGVDVTTPKGYEQAAKLKLDDALQARGDIAASGVTGDDGAVKFLLPRGLYVIETAAPEGAADPAGTLDVVPSLVILPAADAEGHWVNGVTMNLKTQLPGEPGVPPVTPPNNPPVTPPSNPPTDLTFTGASVAGACGLVVVLLIGGSALAGARRGRADVLGSRQTAIGGEDA